MDYSNILQFKYTWRKYQARVLENTKQYVEDGKIHVVAAPGSGKTTLGIELIARMGENALVLAPSITIREQWKERIVDGFLVDGLNPDDYISQDLKNPKAITIATYQALHSAINQRSIITGLKEYKVGLMCLDECHHLRSEWWKALEEFKKEMGALKVIALTATPPYDSDVTMWNRYMDMCGEIDEEIAVPELVKEGNLCPHQDFVYFNYPTDEEKAEVTKFKTRSKEAYGKLMGDEKLVEAIQTYKGLNGLIGDDGLLNNPNYFAAMLIFLQAKNVNFPDRFKKLLGTKRLPEMSPKWMERLLQGFLYSDVENYDCDENYREELIAYLKTMGVIEKKQISFITTPAIEKLLASSKGKSESMKDIVAHEYKSMGKGLRLLVLTDYIREEYEKRLGTNEDVVALGVFPFFEQLRRTVGSTTDIRLGVLCGTSVIIPAEAKDALLEVVGNEGKVTFSTVGKLSETDYVKVNTIGDAHFLTGAVTEVFTKGYMQVLIGTKSLLGEGWDSPCINSLILASFVGSFMLSNQMRGRAIRVFKQEPEKTSNIWHLVCLSSWEDVGDGESEEISEDFALLKRRMEHFLGLHYEDDIIESGMERLSIIKEPFDEVNVAQMNQKMLDLSEKRANLKARWDRALVLHKKMNIVEETEIAETSMPKTVFKEKLTGFIMAAVLFMAVFILRPAVARNEILNDLCSAGMSLLGIYAITNLPRMIQLFTAKKRLQAFGNGIRKAMIASGYMEITRSRVKVNKKGLGYHAVYLAGGSGRDMTLFTKCVNEFFGEIDNPRYLLVRSRKVKGQYDFYVVPECFAKRKEDAVRFYECIKPYMGKYDLVYTRNEAGRKVLMEARLKSIANVKSKVRSYKRLEEF